MNLFPLSKNILGNKLEFASIKKCTKFILNNQYKLLKYE